MRRDAIEKLHKSIEDLKGELKAFQHSILNLPISRKISKEN